VPDVKQQQVSSEELDQLAFEIFKTRVANHPSNRGGENYAIDAYRKAEMFLNIRARVRAGELKPQKPTHSLADACAPNLKPTHPINLVSQRFGKQEKVNRIAAFLEPHKTTPDEELVDKLKREFPDLDWWDDKVLAAARAIIPHFATK
jgi:hypothetical protein